MIYLHALHTTLSSPPPPLIMYLGNYRLMMLLLHSIAFEEHKTITTGEVCSTFFSFCSIHWREVRQRFPMGDPFCHRMLYNCKKSMGQLLNLSKSMGNLIKCWESMGQLLKLSISMGKHEKVLGKHGAAFEIINKDGDTWENGIAITYRQTVWIEGFTSLSVLTGPLIVI